MGAGSSKRPLWYPGEPTGDVSDAGVCWCSESGRPGCSRNDKNKRTPVLVTGTGSVEKGEREIESLPVVELTNWEVGADGCRFRAFVRYALPRHVYHGCEYRTSALTLVPPGKFYKIVISSPHFYMY